MTIELSSWMIYILIFTAKIIELSITTLRTILTARNEKLLNTCLCFMQMTIWILSTSTVVTSITDDPFRAISYVLGCSVGCYLGMVLDEKLALGQNMLTVIISSDIANDVVNKLRSDGFAVTTVKGKGREKDRMILMIATKKKNQRKLIALINKLEPNAMIIKESITTVGGYL